MTAMWIVVQDVGFFLLGGLTFRLIPPLLNRAETKRGHDDEPAN